MSLSRIVNVADGIGKDRMNALKVKGIDTIKSTVEITEGIYDKAGAIVEVAKSAKSLGLKFVVKLSLMAFYKEVMAETGAENRMFVRKAERGGFENTYKFISKLVAENAAPDYVEIETEEFSTIPGLTLGFEEQTRMINGCINAAKAAWPMCKIILSTKDSADNETAKKYFNRFQVSGGKQFDIISLRYELSAETLYELNNNLSDLSRRFEADMIVDISDMADVESADISLEDLDSIMDNVPLGRGFGTVYSDMELEVATLVA